MFAFWTLVAVVCLFILLVIASPEAPGYHGDDDDYPHFPPF